MLSASTGSTVGRRKAIREGLQGGKLEMHPSSSSVGQGQKLGGGRLCCATGTDLRASQDPKAPRDPHKHPKMLLWEIQGVWGGGRLCCGTRTNLRASLGPKAPRDPHQHPRTLLWDAQGGVGAGEGGCWPPLWVPTVHVVVEGELLAGADGPDGKEGDAGQALVQVLNEDVVDLQVGVTLWGVRRGSDRAALTPRLVPSPSHESG